MTTPVRKKQCKACPWKKSTKPREQIPNYVPEMHRDLSNCTTTEIRPKAIRMMACHESKAPREYPCVGWLVNQLGPGNNIALRLQAAFGHLDAKGLKTVGPQYESLEDFCTLGSER